MSIVRGQTFQLCPLFRSALLSLSVTGSDSPLAVAQISANPGYINIHLARD